MIKALNARGNEETLNKFIAKNRYVDELTGQLLGNILNTKNLGKAKVKTLKGDMFDMCKAWDDHYNSGVNEGRIKGIKEERKKRIEFCINLIKRGKLNMQEAAEELEMTINEFEKLYKNADREKRKN